MIIINGLSNMVRAYFPIHTRAETDKQKRQILDQIYILWTKDNNKFLRLGQLIGNIIRDEGTLYNIEDYDLIEKLKKGYKKDGS